MKETFGKRLYDLRKEKGIGQVELAKQLGVGKSIISYWEKDSAEPKLSNIVAIAKYFNISADYLLGLED